MHTDVLKSDVPSVAPGLLGKRIVYAITKANWGGAQAYVYSLAVAAHSAGATVTVVTGDIDTSGGGHGELHKRLTEHGIAVVNVAGIARDIGIRQERRAYLALVQTLSHLRPDVLHLNSSKMGFLGAMAARRIGVPHVVFTAHGWPHRELRAWWWKLMVRAASWATVRWCNVVIVVSDADMRDTPASGSQASMVRIHNGVAPFTLLPRDQARAALAARAWSLEPIPYWFMMNAELHPNKGIDTAIHAWALLARTHTDCALIVCGGGEEQNRLSTLVATLGLSERVHFLGFVEHAKEYLLAADCYVMPSRKEGFPMALLEAGSAGIPIIASNVGGIPDIITEATGTLIPSNDPAALANAIDHTLRDIPAAHAKARALQEIITRDFSEKTMIARTLAVY